MSFKKIKKQGYSLENSIILIYTFYLFGYIFTRGFYSTTGVIILLFTLFFLILTLFKKKFIPEIFKFGIQMGMMTSIGCPFNCRFCSIKACWKKMRFRKISNVLEEIKNLYYDYKVRHIDLFDDLFTINKNRLIEFREELKKEGLLGKISFSCQARVNKH